MKIVFIHGMNKQQYTATSLRQHWLHLFKTGLQKNPQQQARFTYLKRHIRIPFYGDLLSRHHFHNVLNASTLMPQQWPHFPFLHPAQLQPASPPDQCTYQICDVPQSNLDDILNFNRKLKFITALSKDIALRDFAVLINYFPSLHASFLHKFCWKLIFIWPTRILCRKFTAAFMINSIAAGHRFWWHIRLAA